MSSEADQLRAELAEARQRMDAMAAAQEEFLRAVSHDLRAPLRHFTSFGALVQENLHEVLRDAPSDLLQEALDFLATMDQSARRMGRMIDGLQALSRAARAPLQLQPVALAEVLEQARAALVQAAVDWRIAPDLPVLRADPALLQDMVAELLGNAVKFTERTAQPSVAVQADAAPPGYVAFTVVDNGAGFDPARAGLLFGVFQRLHRESEFDGVGAGLARCRTIAQRHGASITATAEPGHGCTVRVVWPAA